MDRPVCCGKPMQKKERVGGTVKEPTKKNKQVWKCGTCKRTLTLLYTI